MLLSKQALAQQMDQMADMAELSAAQIQANNSMNRMTHMMGQSSRTMSLAQKNMNPEKVCRVDATTTVVIPSASTYRPFSISDPRYIGAVQTAK